MEYEKSETELIHVTNCGNKLYGTYYYPKENPPNALRDIVDCMEYIGLFDGIKKEQ